MHLLLRTLQSLEEQVTKTTIDWHITVVDNNCTDKTFEAINQLINKATLPLSIIHEEKQGLTRARLCGVRNTTREWLAFIDDDCLLARDWLEETAAFAKAHRECGAFGGRISLSWECTPPEYIYRFPFAFAGKDHGSTAFKRKWLAGLGMTLRREALNETGWVQQPLLEDRIGNKLVSGGDMEIGLRISVLHEVWYSPDCRITHIIPERRTSRLYLQKMLFGLGASRHNVTALVWKQGYPLFLIYSILMLAGFLLKGIIEGTMELFSNKHRAGYAVNFSPGFGWSWALWQMLLMPKQRKSQMLGGVYRTSGY